MEEKSREHKLSAQEITLIRELTQIRNIMDPLSRPLLKK